MGILIDQILYYVDHQDFGVHYSSFFITHLAVSYASYMHVFYCMLDTLALALAQLNQMIQLIVKENVSYYILLMSCLEYHLLHFCTNYKHFKKLIMSYC